MIPDVTINGVSMLSLGWIRESVSFPAPDVQTETISVWGRNSPIRYTSALGKISYAPRTFEIVLSCLKTRSEFNRLSEEVINRFLGQLVKVVLSEEPNLYVLGTLKTEPSYDAKTGTGKLVLSSDDADAYRYHVEETVVTISGSGEVLLNNDYMPTVPTVTTTAETTFKWSVGSDTFVKTVSTGTWEFPELELSRGNSTVNVEGDGQTSFTYREGRL